MNNRCKMCHIEYQAKRVNSKFCSPKCRVTFNRHSVTDDVNVTDNTVEAVTFNFTIVIGKNNPPDVIEAKSKVRSAKYWYDVPLAAVPVLQEGWPEMPGFMNGRQYFLWWKNEFRTKDGEPVILNPYPKYEKLAGQGSRRWGA
jgi:hypothetical protein